MTDAKPASTLATLAAKTTNLTPVVEVVYETVDGQAKVKAYHGIRPDYIAWTNGKPTLTGNPDVLLELPKFLIGQEALAAVNAIRGEVERCDSRSCLLPIALHRIAQQDPHAHAAVMMWAQGDTGPDHACLMVAAALVESKADVLRAFSDHLKECGHSVNEARARLGLPRV